MSHKIHYQRVHTTKRGETYDRSHINESSSYTHCQDIVDKKQQESIARVGVMIMYRPE